jgi:DNA-directed RNA polymerase beta subunit
MFKQPNSSDMTGARITIGAADATKDKKKVKSEDKTDELPEIIKELKSSMDESESRIQKEKSLSGNITITSSATFAPFIHAYIKEHGPTEHHLNSFNQLISHKYGLDQILTQIFSIQSDVIPERTPGVENENSNIEHISINVQFSNISYIKPNFPNSNGALTPAYPQWARNNSRTYSASVYANVVITASAYLKVVKPGEKNPNVKTVTLNRYQIATIPVMVRSVLCHTHNICPAQLILHKEDPKDPGGYFIINGKDFAIISVESITYNALHIQKNKAKDELVRGVYLSKPGDGFENSFQITIRLHTNMMISLQFGSEPLSRLLIPFYLIYRMFGMTSDADIINTVTYCANSFVNYANIKPSDVNSYSSMELRYKMNNILAHSITNAPVPKGTDQNPERDFTTIRNNRIPEEITQFMATKLSKFKGKDLSDNNIRYSNTEFLAKIDSNLFPHMGGTKERILKLKLLGHCIELILKVHLDVIMVTDKDSYHNKRIFPPAYVLSREIKRGFHNVEIKPLRNKLINAYKTNQFSSVDGANVFQTAVKPIDLEKALIKAIQTGKKEIVIGQVTVASRIMSQDITWKNQLFFFAIMRTIAPTDKPVSNTSARAISLRSVHPTTINAICPIQTHETGEKVGKLRQLTIMARLTSSGSSEILYKILQQDEDIYSIDSVNEAQRLEYGFTKVFINGKWVGLTDVIGHTLAHKYRLMRRRKEIDLYTSIYVNPMSLDIFFSTEQGRIVFPLLVVDGHGTEKGQDVLLTDKDLKGLTFGIVSIKDLEDRGVIDYITCEEQDNTLIAEDYKTLRENAHNPVIKYTHCQIPQGLLSYIALSSPFGNYTDTVRVSYMTNHTRQACEWPTLNFGERCERKFYVQTYIEYPLVQSIITPHCHPFGTNLRVAYCPYKGYNQEDSAIYNASSSDRGSIAIMYYTFLDATIEKGEFIMNPDASNTQLAIHVNYSKIVDGFPKKGTIIMRDDAVIGRVQEINSKQSGYKYKDNSVIYKANEPAVVDSILKEINSEGKRVYKVKLRSYRKVCQGDKVSSRYGNKSIASMIIPACELPVTVDGEIPDIIIDSQGISKRMLLGQINECIMSLLATKLGATIDGTTFSHIDYQALEKALNECGIYDWGFKKMINGETGELYDALICMCSNYYLRIQKFIIDGMYSVGSGPTDSLTRQPLKGKAARGGFRICEMTKDCLLAHGCMFTFKTKFHDNSDGYTSYICRRCGKSAIYNAEKSIYSCLICKNKAEIISIATSWMSHIFNQQLNASHIDTKYNIKPITFYKTT